MSRSGKYDRDKGDRDTPTCNDFLNNTPVKQTIVIPKNYSLLNRKGRAIARIVHAHGWSVVAIARIFRVPSYIITSCVRPAPSRVTDVKRFRQDVPGDDYDYVDKEFKLHFPPMKRQGSSDVDAESDSEEDWRPGPKTRRKARKNLKSQFITPKKTIVAKIPSRPVKKPRYTRTTAKSAAPVEVLRRPIKLSRFVPARAVAGESDGSDSESSVVRMLESSNSLPRRQPSTISLSLQDFIQSLLPHNTSKGITTPAHLALYETQGFTVERFHALAQWPEDEISEALTRLLLRQSTKFGLDVFEIVTLEVALKELAAITETSMGSTVDDSTSLRAFLLNVHGFNFSAHVQLFRAHGFTLDRLRLLSAGASKMPEIINRGLQKGSAMIHEEKGSGLSPLEVIALEFALR
ncbi:hypothetical protein C8F01DRAFT_1148081 [Mycena amicta]|nr:hypothetical protein C8F01DRAFT_1148073 [Mycena amicta]KAJ7058394.1 hypothetical protein C8F01DRAFT_1148081 [Mycena amicta]